MPRVSPFWAYFLRDTPKKDIAQCKLCPTQIGTKQSTKTGLKVHIRGCHNEIFLNIGKENLKRAPETTAEQLAQESILDTHGPIALSAKRVKMDISSYCKVVTKYGTNDKRQLIADLDIVKYLCMGNLAFQHVSSPAFKDFLLSLRPEIIIRAPLTYSRNKLPILYSNVFEAVLNVLTHDLKDVDAVGFTSDLWSSKSNESFTALTLHYITTGFELKTFLLGCNAFPDSHTGDNISIKTDTLISVLPFNNGCKMTSVTDSAANMISGMKKSAKIDESISCIAHLLHLVIIKSVKEVDEIEKVFQVRKTLSARTHKSINSQQRIMKACNDVIPEKIKFNKIISPCPTRWNSGFMCMDSILHLRLALEIIASSNLKTDDILRALIPSSDEFDVIEKVVPIMKLFNDFTEVVSSEKIPTSQRVVPGLFDIQENIKKLILPNDKITGDFVTKLLSNLNKRFPDCGSRQKNNALAHLLDPKFKGLLLTRFGQDDVALRDLKEISIGKQPSNLIENTTQTVSPKQDLSPAEQLLFEMMGQDSNASELYRSSKDSPFDIELEAYKRLGFPDKNYNILEWWKIHSPQLPILSRAAKKVLCVPASSTSSERVFSQAGNIVSCKRTLLKAETIEKLVYVKINISKVTNKK
ncbi:zinc finger BED domain-containing protein 4-like [Hydra vulgaris]|uniref:zinc finger BED domain-containing protein 4-like n=1 Tax=Hydra vulgaris TaxID=6087 RepID=UPI001F5EF5DD|nr:zinc finger BED domain-containing protein 4-like [Hydra vulgaris]